MFEYIKGTLASASPHKITVDVKGLGYGLFITVATFEKLPQIGKEVKVFISTVIREDSHKMYAFLDPKERDFFETLNEISGIGPRLSLAILGHMDLSELHLAAEHADTKAITKIPGIGKKMAERLIIELRDKFTKFDKQNISLPSKRPQGVMHDAISALINLGYNANEAQKSVEAVFPEGKEPPLPELISLALKAKK